MTRRKDVPGEEGMSPSSLFLFPDHVEDDSPSVPTPPTSQPCDDVGVHDERTVQRWVGIVSYLGAGFHGFAVQEGLRTVAGELETVLARVFQSPIALTCSGRTDAGVHAVAQVISFDAPRPSRRSPLLKSVNQLLPPEIRVSLLEEAPAEFDARYSARYRQYVYRLGGGLSASALSEGRRWVLEHELDLHAMRNASYSLIGEHDFLAFCKSSRGVERPTTRRIFDIDVRSDGSFVDVALWANSFCQQMVRSLIGVLVEVGLHKRHGSEVREILVRKDRRQVRLIAPPGGLYLYSVGFVPFERTLVDEWRKMGFIEHGIGRHEALVRI